MLQLGSDVCLELFALCPSLFGLLEVGNHAIDLVIFRVQLLILDAVVVVLGDKLEGLVWLDEEIATDP